MRTALLALPLLALAGCNGGFDMNVSGDNVSIHSDMVLNDADVDLNGVRLYPGSTVNDFRIDAHGGKKDEDGSGNVVIKFDSPAGVAKVRDWLRDSVSKRGYALTDTADGFTGQDSEGRTVRLTLTAQGTDHTRGELAIGG